MNFYLFAATLLIILLGLIHSFLGERLIFRHLRKNGRWIDTGIDGLRIRQIRSLWSTWHLITLFGWAIASVLWAISSMTQTHADMRSIIIKIVYITFAIATPFWWIGTKGKHPAWIVFLAIALLAGMSG